MHNISIDKLEQALLDFATIKQAGRWRDLKDQIEFARRDYRDHRLARTNNDVQVSDELADDLAAWIGRQHREACHEAANSLGSWEHCVLQTINRFAKQVQAQQRQGVRHAG